MHVAEGTLTYRGTEKGIRKKAWRPRGVDPHAYNKLQDCSQSRTQKRITERMQDKYTRLTHSAGRTKHEFHRKVNAKLLRNTCKCTQSRRVSVARYVFYQLKSVTLSCDLNIYELFPGRCCITPKLFILVSVGPTFGMMIEYENGCTFCCEG